MENNNDVQNTTNAGNEDLADVMAMLRKLLPTLEETVDAKNAYKEKKSISGYSTNLEGVGNHFQDGVNWALNYLCRKAKSN